MQWLIIDEFPKYSLSRAGQVRHNRTKRILTPHMNQAGVVHVEMYGEHGRKQRGLAKLVARAFLPCPYPADQNPSPINLDGDRWNCAVGNLAWRPRWFAYEYHQQFTYPHTNPIERPIRLVGTDMVFGSSFEAATHCGLLEYKLIDSIFNGTPVWPTLQSFEIVKE